jgi:hypothetical protein
LKEGKLSESEGGSEEDLAEIRKELDIGSSFHLPVCSQKSYKSLKILGSKVPLRGYLEALYNGYGG